MSNKTTEDLTIENAGDLDQVLLKIHRYAKSVTVERNNLQHLKSEIDAITAERDRLAARLAEIDPAFDGDDFKKGQRK